MSGNLEIRCPYCLASQTVPAVTGVRKRIACPRCHRRFELQDARPPESRATQASNAAAARRAVPLPSAPELAPGLLATAMAGALVIGECIAWSTLDRDGPDFLFIHVVVFVVTWLAQWFARARWVDAPGTSAIAAAVLVGCAAGRYLHGRALGMQHFEMLLFLTIFGLVLYFARNDRSTDGGGAGGCSGGGCGSGGGGGGGGCGGCGGD